MLSLDVFCFLQDIADLRKAFSEANRTEELYRSQSTEQIRSLLATVAELQQRVLSLEKDKKSVSVGGVAESSETSEISLCRCQSSRFVDWILNPATLFPHYLSGQVNDTTVSLPVSSEGGAAVHEDDSTTSKPLPDEAEGAVQGRKPLPAEQIMPVNFIQMFSLSLSHASPQWSPPLPQSLRPADFHVSPLSLALSRAPRKHVQRKFSCLESVL